MSKTEWIVKIIERTAIKADPFAELHEGRIQMFDCRGFGIAANDYKVCLYKDLEGVEVLWASGWDYVEVLGLSEKDYKEVFDAVGYGIS